MSTVRAKTGGKLPIRFFYVWLPVLDAIGLVLFLAAVVDPQQAFGQRWMAGMGVAVSALTLVMLLAALPVSVTVTDAGLSVRTCLGDRYDVVWSDLKRSKRRVFERFGVAAYFAIARRTASSKGLGRTLFVGRQVAALIEEWRVESGSAVNPPTIG